MINAPRERLRRLNVLAEVSMKNICSFVSLATVLAVCTSVVRAEVVTLKCEEWHPRLGQMADKVIAIDASAKTCNGQPCIISDTELKWNEQNGRVSVVVNRTAGEGTVVYQGDLAATYKNCKVGAAKP